MLTRGPARTRRSRLTAGALAAFASLGLAIAGAVALVTPASAATPGVLLSSDGVTYSTTYTGTLFSSTALMVPQSSQSGRFWVKNGSSEPAYLRVSVKAVSGTGSAFSGAVSVRADTTATSGSSVPVEAARPCYVLNQGQLLAPGDVVRIDAMLTLGDMTGTWGQQSNVRFDIVAGLSSAATGSMPATECLTGSVTVPAVPSTPGGGGTGTDGGTGETSGDASGTVDLDTLNPGAFAGEDQTGGILRSNTERLFQEWFVLLWVGGAVAGGGAHLVLARRRAYDEDDEYVAEEVQTWRGSGRIDGRRAWSTT